MRKDAVQAARRKYLQRLVLQSKDWASSFRNKSGEIDIEKNNHVWTFLGLQFVFINMQIFFGFFGNLILSNMMMFLNLIIAGFIICWNLSHTRATPRTLILKVQREITRVGV